MNPGNVDVSVVIVNWNTRDLLLDAIRSLLETTTRTSIEIIVVDNASHDGSPDAVRAAHPEVKLIQNEDNLGFAKANNIGFRIAKGRAFCLVNTDVVALDGVIDKLWDYLDSHPSVALVGPRMLNRDLGTRQNVRRFPSLSNSVGDYLWLKKLGLLPGRALPPSTYDRTHSAEVLSGGFLMVRRDAFDQVGPLDEDFFFYGEDTDWCRRFHDAGWGVDYNSEARAIHFGGGSTAPYPVKYSLMKERADLLYWRKHYSQLHQALYVGIRVTHHALSIAGWTGAWLFSPARREQAGHRLTGHVTNAVYLLTGRSLA